MEPAAAPLDHPSNPEKVAHVLQLVVQHADTWDQRWVMQLLQTNSTVKAALQQGVGSLNVGCWLLDLSCLHQVTCFGAWLPTHCGLVQNLNLSLPCGVTEKDQPGWEAAERVITFALQFCVLAAGMRTPAAAPAQYQAGAPEGLPTAALRLRSFRSDYVHSPAALNSLASCSTLTRLYLYNIPQQRLTATFTAALGRLHSLKHIDLAALDEVLFPPPFAAALGQLTQLESLCIHSGRVHAHGLEQLPPSLQSVDINVAPGTDGPADIDLGCLSNLQDLSLYVPGGVSAQSHLPADLTALTLCGPAQGMHGLEGLQSLRLGEPQAALPLLQCLPQLLQLQDVKVGLEGCSQEQIEQIFVALAAATQLTALQAYSTDADQEEDTYAGVSCEGVLLHKHLRRLPQLHLLHLSGLQLDMQDAIHFTALSALKDLSLVQCAISDMAVAATLQRLTGLCSLVLDELRLTSPLVWVAAACLTNLQDLCCRCNPGATLTAETLHLLAPLTQLTSLELDEPVGEDGQTVPVNQAVVAEFLAGMPLLHRIDFV